jgi:hypothetical protein
MVTPPRLGFLYLYSVISFNSDVAVITLFSEPCLWKSSATRQRDINITVALLHPKIDEDVFQSELIACCSEADNSGEEWWDISKDHHLTETVDFSSLPLQGTDLTNRQATSFRLWTTMLVYSFQRETIRANWRHQSWEWLCVIESSLWFVCAELQVPPPPSCLFR